MMQTTKTVAFGLGLRRSKAEKTLDVSYPEIAWQNELELLSKLREGLELTQEQNGIYEVSAERFEALAKLCQGSCFESFARRGSRRQRIRKAPLKISGGPDMQILFIRQKPEAQSLRPEQRLPPWQWEKLPPGAQWPRF